jgi:hypothetical protein
VNAPDAQPLFFNPNLLHASLPNLSPFQCAKLIFGYNGSTMRRSAALACWWVQLGDARRFALPTDRPVSTANRSPYVAHNFVIDTDLMAAARVPTARLVGARSR